MRENTADLGAASRPVGGRRLWCRGSAETLTERNEYGPGNHGPGRSSTVRRRTEAVQRGSSESHGLAAGAVCLPGGYLAGPGAPQILGGIQTDLEGIEKVCRDLQRAHPLPHAQSPANRGVSQPTLASWRNNELMSRRSMRWNPSGPA